MVFLLSQESAYNQQNILKSAHVNPLTKQSGFSSAIRMKWKNSHGLWKIILDLALADQNFVNHILRRQVGMVFLIATFQWPQQEIFCVIC